MKEIVLKTLILILFVCFSFQSCNKNQDELNPEIEVQDFIWKAMNAYYLHQDEISDLSDTKFNSNQQLENFLYNFETPEEIFNSLKKTSDSKSTLIEDYIINDTPIPLRSSFTSGLEFGIFKNPTSLDSVIGYSSHILPLSYAENENISRGDFFYAVINQDNDTVRLAENNYRELLIDYPQDTLKLLMANFDGSSFITNNQRVDLVKKNYQYPPVLLKKVFDLGVKKAGYLLYNNDFSANYIGDLNATMQEFKNESVNELIIDLRYSIGSDSYAKTISEIASMITGQFPNEIFIKETWNEKAQSWFELNQPDSVLTRYPTTIYNNETINSLNLSDVYIILNGEGFTGSSSIELLINGLRPYINVHVLGNTTSGSNIGSIYLYDSPDYDFNDVNTNHMYSVAPSVLTFSNKENNTYRSGISPTITLCSIENPLNLGELGEISDPLLDITLSYMLTGDAAITVLCNPFDLDIVYNSISTQRIVDKGTFIKQDLPNLGR